ncbi:virulence factor [Stappia sp. F7233]|uniref:Virulence factor n=1 Tax=Stappia albiluteola TaxID=2758565 RepID=A0A839AJU9_9HYPH|nr:virulence factor [Stappia albiluteola]MBA5779346.1 virulence factor [Stappia albiluteola]
MAERIIVYWRDIPAQILVRAGRKAARRELPERFIQAIDRCAMSVGVKDSDAYLAEWRRGSPEEIAGDLEAAADKALTEIDAVYTAERLKALIAAGGFDNA